MPYSIAMIPYTNMAPYRELGEPKDCRFKPLIPKESITALHSGRVLAAAVPVGGLFALKDLVEPIGRFGIAAKQKSMSVVLFSRRPFEKIDGSCALRLSGDSASSVRLLYLLLGYRLGFDRLPGVAGSNDRVDAELVIGDAALKRTLRPTADDTYVSDLAELWYRRHGLPFVFARWVVRQDAPKGVKMILSDWLQRFREQEDDLVARCTQRAAENLRMPIEWIATYFRVIRRSLDGEDLVGQRRFEDEIRKYGREILFDRN
jgi:predicted solute-binding protein